LLQKIFGTLDNYFITTHTIHNCHWSTSLLLYDIPRNKSPRPIPRHTWSTCKPWSFSVREVKRGGSEVEWISLASVVYNVSLSHQIFAAAALGLSTKLGVLRSWLFQLPQSYSFVKAQYNSLHFVSILLRTAVICRSLLTVRNVDGSESCNYPTSFYARDYATSLFLL
jgi:hypothetical protein